MAVMKLYLHSEQDVPFVDQDSLKQCLIEEVDYFSQKPFICLGEAGEAVIKSAQTYEGCEFQIDTDKKEPMNKYSIEIKIDELCITLVTDTYMRPGREKRPPRSENKSTFPWGFYYCLELGGEIKVIREFVMKIISYLGRLPYSGFEWKEIKAQVSMNKEDI